MIERFQGRDGRAALLNALRSQFLVDGNTDIADLMASVSKLREFAAGAEIFTEGDRGGDLFLLISGQVSIRKHGHEIETYGAGMHVGEIGLLEPFKGRTATVVALETVVAAQISELNFTEIAKAHPNLWRRMALQLARRLLKTQDAV
jgi:CRP/FNR family transcriptional regulator, cyclic AMP receptor protein